jgi:hypothetical protein
MHNRRKAQGTRHGLPRIARYETLLARSCRLGRDVCGPQLVSAPETVWGSVKFGFGSRRANTASPLWRSPGKSSPKQWLVEG